MHCSKDRSRNSPYNRNQNYSNNGNRNYSTGRSQTTLTISHYNNNNIDPVITPEIETTTTQIDRETILSHHIEINLIIQNHKVKTTEVADQKIKHKIIKYTHTKISELKLNHVHCETTDDESETEITLSIKMVHVQNEYETPIESNY